MSTTYSTSKSLTYNNDFDNWTTTKKKVHHNKREVETHVSQQLLLKDGKVIANSGPQVTTRIKEDNKLEECDKEKTPKGKGKYDKFADCESSLERVLGEKKEVQKITKEVRQENLQYHDERFKELTGRDVHERALRSPHELFTITDKKHQGGPPRGKMVHYSKTGKLTTDTDEIFSVAKLASDGSVTKEVKRTHHHQEESEDEEPEREEGEADRLRRKPVELKSNRRRADYVNDFNDTATPPESDADEIEGDIRAIKRHQESRESARSRDSGRSRDSARSRLSYKNDDLTSTRYQIDSMLNSLKHRHNNRY